MFSNLNVSSRNNNSNIDKNNMTFDMNDHCQCTAFIDNLLINVQSDNLTQSINLNDVLNYNCNNSID